MSAYQRVKLDEVPDWLGDYPGEMRGITYPIGAEQVALTYRRMPKHTGSKGSYGHRHRTQEELYFVISGRLQFKLGDEIVELGPHEPRVEDPQGDAETVDGFWPE
jgi:quercetin dioxygenase-like cupin family protein